MKHVWITIGIAGLLAACGMAGERTLTDEPVGFSLSLDGDGQISAAPFVVASEENEAASLTLTAATVNVAELALKVGPGICDGDDGESREGDIEIPDSERKPDGTPLAIASATTAETVEQEEVQSADCKNGFLVVEGPFQIDLISGESTPSLAAMELSPGTYRWIDLRVAPVDDEDASMNNITLVADGEYENGTTVPVHVALTMAEPPMRIQPADGIVIEQEGGVDISVEIQERDWFKGIDEDLAMCAESESAPLVDGVLQITGTTGGACDRVNGTLRQNFIGAGLNAPVTLDRKR